MKNRFFICIIFFIINLFSCATNSVAQLPEPTPIAEIESEEKIPSNNDLSVDDNKNVAENNQIQNDPEPIIEPPVENIFPFYVSTSVDEEPTPRIIQVEPEDLSDGIVSDDESSINIDNDEKTKLLTPDIVEPIDEKKQIVVKRNSQSNIETKPSSSVDREKTASKLTGESKTSTIQSEPTVQIAMASENVVQRNFDADEILKKAEKAFLKKQYQQALTLIDELFFKSTEKLDEGLFLRGKIYEVYSGQGNIKKARDAYQTLVTAYPQSSFWNEAKERIIYIDRFYFNVW